jgi:hypothetical protein
LKLKGNVVLFADDILIIYIGDNEIQIMENMQHDLELLLEWFKVNMLTINDDKIKYMFFHKTAYKPDSMNQVHTGLKEIERVKSFNYLGLNIDILKWNVHVDYIRKKLLPVLMILPRLRHKGLNIQYLRSVYCALIHSHLSYLDIISSNCTKEMVNALWVLQNRLLKIIFNLPYRTHTKDLYKFTKVVPLFVSFKMSKAIYMYKIQHNLMLSNVQPKTTEIHNYNIRNK